MYVIKRDGHKEPVMFDKITDRIKNYAMVWMICWCRESKAMRVIEGLYDGVSTSD
jgi:ribonucleoside-diphosphate reductase alpha chain